MIRKIALSTAALAVLAAGSAGLGQAQVYPYQGPPPPVRPYAESYVSRGDVRGWIATFDRFSMTLHAAGRRVQVNLHQGTVILPTGLTLEPGMHVNVSGYWTDGGFHADRIILLRGDRDDRR